MIRRANRQKDNGSEPFTYIHQGTTLEGNLVAQGRVRVHGVIRGDVTVHGVLEVAESGEIEGSLIRADEVKVIGLVKADIEAKGKIEIWKTGRLFGDVRASALDIEEGAGFTGRSEMNPGGQAVATLTAQADSLEKPLAD